MLSHFLRKLLPLAGRPAADTVRAGGLVWRVVPGAAPLLGGRAPDLSRWRAAGLLTDVKQNLQRTISVGRLPGGTVYVKLCRANTPRAWVRELLRPAKARLEWENALALRGRGVPAVEPVAWGAASPFLPGASILVTKAQPHAVPFVELLETTLPAMSPAEGRAVRRQLARALAAFLARMHDAGVAHPDPHPGNFLVELPPSRVPRFVLLDVHAVRFGPPLTRAETVADLTLLNRWFQMRATRTDRLRFWRAYLAARATLPLAPDAAADLARELETATLASNNRFWANRIGRYLSANREFRRVRGPAARGHAVRDLPAELLATWLADPDAPFAAPGVRLLKDGRSSTVAEIVVPTAAGRVPLIYKRFRVRSGPGLVKNLFRRSAALRSWVNGHGLRDRGLPTARPLAAFHRVRNGLPAEGYLVCEKVPGGVELPAAVAAAPGAVRGWADRLGRVLQAMHDRGVSHRDLKAANVLLANLADPVLIDLVGVTAGKPVPRHQRVRDLARLNASFLASPAVTRADRLRLLRAYLGWGLHGRGEWKGWWADIDRATRAKAARNARVGRPLS